MNLETYHAIRAALAADKLVGVVDPATKLSTSSNVDVAKAATTLARARDLATARRAFAELSKAVIAATEHEHPTTPAHLYECSMAKPYGRWLQDRKEIGNPYYGAAMLRCGRLIETRAP